MGSITSVPRMRPGPREGRPPLAAGAGLDRRRRSKPISDGRSRRMPPVASRHARNSERGGQALRRDCADSGRSSVRERRQGNGIAGVRRPVCGLGSAARNRHHWRMIVTNGSGPIARASASPRMDGFARPRGGAANHAARFALRRQAGLAHSTRRRRFRRLAHAADAIGTEVGAQVSRSSRATPSKSRM